MENYRTIYRHLDHLCSLTGCAKLGIVKGPHPLLRRHLNNNRVGRSCCGSFLVEGKHPPDQQEEAERRGNTQPANLQTWRRLERSTVFRRSLCLFEVRKTIAEEDKNEH